MGAFERLKGFGRKPKREPTEEEKILGAARIGGGLGPEEKKRSVQRKKKEVAPDTPVILPPDVKVDVNLGDTVEGNRSRIIRQVLKILGKKTPTAEERRKQEDEEEVQRMLGKSK